VKRVTMGGTDPVRTDDRIADLILEYATELGRAGTTSAVTVPAVIEGRFVEASMLLGPASQITLLPDEDERDAVGALPGVEAVAADLRARIDRLTGRGSESVVLGDVHGFPGFDPFEE
jgi:hypothetical protein